MQSAVSTIITEILVKINTSSESLTVGSRAAQDSLGCSPSREFSVGSCGNGGDMVLQSNHLVNEVDASNGSRSLLLFRYLLNCFGRLKSREHASSVEDIDGFSELLSEVSRQLLRQAALVASGAYETSSDENAAEAAMRQIVINALSSRFLDACVAQIDADGDSSSVFDEVFLPILDGFIRVVMLCCLSSDKFRQPMSMLKELCQLKTTDRRLVFGILGSPFVSEATSRDAFDEKQRVQDKCFVDGDAITPEAQAHFSQTIRRLIGILREDVHELVFSVVANASSREKALEFISEIVKRNAEKAKLWVEPSKLCTNIFALNLLAVMYRLSLEITVDKVNALYPFYSGSKVDITQASRLKLSSNEAKEFAQSLSNTVEDINFLTECFFLTLHMQHIVLTPAIGCYGEQLRRQSQIYSAFTQLERMEHFWGNPQDALRFRHFIRLQKAELLKTPRSRACIEAHLLDQSLLGAAFQFCTKTLSLLAQVARSSGPDFPLPVPANKLFAALPEFYLEDALDIFIFTLKYAPKVLSEDPCVSDFVPAFLTFLCSPNCFNKPFLAAKFVEAMFLTCQQEHDRLYKSLLSHQIAIQALFRSLVKFYSDCEFTGSHTEFYDKFTIRYNIQIIFKTMWQDVIHQSIMIEQCGECGVEFIRFVNMLINDTTFLLNEALDGFKRIHETQELRKNTDAWASLQADEQTQRASRLAQDVGFVRSYMQLAKETLELFCYLTKKVQEPFLSAPIGSRLTAMLNSNLLQLCGPKCSKLKDTDAKKYSFNPKSLLNSLTDIYLHLDSQRFWDFLASDERSYSKDLFDSVTSRLKQSSIKPQPQIEAFELLAERVFGVWKTNLEQKRCLFFQFNPAIWTKIEEFFKEYGRITNFSFSKKDYRRGTGNVQFEDPIGQNAINHMNSISVDGHLLKVKYDEKQKLRDVVPSPRGQLPTSSGQLPASSGQLPTPSGQLPSPSGQLPTSSGQLPPRRAQLAPHRAQLAPQRMQLAHRHVPAQRLRFPLQHNPAIANLAAQFAAAYAPHGNVRPSLQALGAIALQQSRATTEQSQATTRQSRVTTRTIMNLINQLP